MVRTRITPRAIPAVLNPAPDTISNSGSSTTTAPPPAGAGRKQTPPVVIEEVELTVGDLNAMYRDMVKETNTFLRTYGRIALVRPEGPYLDLNAVAPPADGSQPPPPPQVNRPRPVICVFCKCAFCFSVDELRDLDHVYPAPEVPITLNLLTTPAVAPLNRYGVGEAPRTGGAMPARPPLLVCDSDYHFKVTMGILQQQLPGGAPKLDWLCSSCLSVAPIVVGTASSADLRRATNPAPSLDPLAYARAFWDYVEPGDEDMVELHLHDDPLNLTLGRR